MMVSEQEVEAARNKLMEIDPETGGLISTQALRKILEAAAATRPEAAEGQGPVAGAVKAEVGSEHSWPDLKKAIWTTVIEEKLNDGHYINAYDLTEKLYRAALASPVHVPEGAALASAGELEALIERLRRHYDHARETHHFKAAYTIEEVIAALRSKAPEGMGWRSMESAPAACHVLACYWSDEFAEWVYSVEMSPPSSRYTLWRPLPPTPDERPAAPADDGPFDLHIVPCDRCHGTGQLIDERPISPADREGLS